MRQDSGQTIVEYTMIITLIMVILFSMGPAIKRGAQSLMKITADQIGNQQNADQDFSDTQQGYMVGTNSAVMEASNKQVTDIHYVTQTLVNESTETVTNVISNGGFNPDQNQ